MGGRAPGLPPLDPPYGVLKVYFQGSGTSLIDQTVYELAENYVSSINLHVYEFYGHFGLSMEIPE